MKPAKFKWERDIKERERNKPLTEKVFPKSTPKDRIITALEMTKMRCEDNLRMT